MITPRLTATARRTGIFSALALSLAVSVFVAGANQAFAAEPPVKETIASHFGTRVDKTTGGSVCTVASRHECVAGAPSDVAGGFEYPEGVAGNGNGEIYIADTKNHRVQALSDAGAFVAMFGWDVNSTKDKEGAPQSERNICTATSGDICQGGMEGVAPGQFGYPTSVVVDPTSGDVYVAETSLGEADGEKTFGERVQKFTSEGRFLLEIGKEVNETTKGNLCTQAEIEALMRKCKGPSPRPSSAVEEDHAPGEFSLANQEGNVLAVGGPEDLLYVGDEHRVQKFDASGQYKGEIALVAISSAPGKAVTAIAAGESGELYLAYGDAYGEGSNVIREFDSSGDEVANVEVPGAVNGIALRSGRLAAAGGSGALYDASTLRLTTKFTTEEDTGGISFGEGNSLYAVAHNEVIEYSPVLVGEPITGAAPCVPGVEHESDVTIDCSVTGEVNPWGVADTETSFQFGRTSALGSETAKHTVCTMSCGSTATTVSDSVEGVAPNETLFYRLDAYDANIQPPEEALTGIERSLTTPSVPPRIVGEASASFIANASADLNGELNPENTPTRYFFQYAACQSTEPCPALGENAGVQQTATQEAGVYGPLGATFEVSGLQPSTLYRYRMVANNEHVVEGKTVGGEAIGPEASFTTAAAPVPDATTFPPSALGATTATIAGAVNPDGQLASYAFELGVYQGSATEYGIVFSGSAGASTTPVEESLGLTGLQPGVTYAYRVKISSGYGTAYGEPATFTTAGLPSVLATPVSLPMLATPGIAFPTEPKPTVVKKTIKCAKGKKLGHGKCMKSKPSKGKRKSRQGSKGKPASKG